MKKIALFSICFCLLVASNGQITQKGIVKEYNSHGKTLSGVGISIPSANDFQPAISNSDGTFQLHFSHHRAGDVIYNVKITKDDYEIVNIYDFKDGWTLSTQDTMTIIVARRGVIAEKRSRYYNIMDKYTEESYKKKIRKLKEELANQTINAEEYRQRTLAAEEELRRAYEKIDAYADLFARVDVDAMDSTSSLAIHYLQEGNIDQAIRLFEDLNLVEQLNRKVALRNQSEDAIQQLIPKLREEIAYRNLAGGTRNLERIDLIYNSIIASDPDNFEYQKDYVQFLVEENNLDKANAMGEKILLSAQAPLEKKIIGHELGMIQYKKNHYSTAIEILKQALSETVMLKEGDSITYLLQQSDILNTLANVYIDVQQYSQAQECLNTSNILGRQLVRLDSTKLYLYASNLSNISELYRSIGILNRDSASIQQALRYNEDAISVLESISDSNIHDPQYHLGIKYNNRGSIFLETSHLDSALFYLGKADTLWNKIYSKNPHKYVVSWCNTLANLALAYSRDKQYEQAHLTYSRALTLCQSAVSTHSLKPIMVSMLTSEGVLLRKEKRYEDAKLKYLAALKLQEELMQEDNQHYSQAKEYIYNNLAVVCFFAKQLDSAVQYYTLQREELEGIIREHPGYDDYGLAECTYYIAYCYYNLKDAKHGIPAYKKARRLFVQYGKKAPGRYDKVLADIDQEMRELRSARK